MGLYDTPEGIRFRQALLADDSSNVNADVTNESDEVPEGMEALVIAATDPVVRAAHEKRQASPVSESLSVTTA